MAPSARAEETTCRNSIGARTVVNLRVPDGATCRLTGTTVQGTVKVETNATLVASNIRVIGNVQAENHRAVTVTGSRIGGSIQFDQGGKFTVRDNRVTGDIQVKSNQYTNGPSVIRANIVNHDVQAFSNRGGIEIAGNRIDANLQCKENSPAPTGGNNRVQGNKEDQCKRL
jgi:hypothetical protein